MKIESTREAKGIIELGHYPNVVGKIGRAHV